MFPMSKLLVCLVAMEMLLTNESYWITSDLAAFEFLIDDHSSDSAHQHRTIPLSLNREQVRLLKFIVYGIFVPVCAAFGTIGNFLTIVILSRNKIKSSSNCFLCGLACADLVVTAATVLRSSIPKFIPGTDYRETTDGLASSSCAFLCLVPYLHATILTGLTGSVYFTLAVTVERYIAACHPLKAKSILTFRRACVVSILILLFAVLLNITRWFEYEIITLHKPSTGDLIGYRKVPTCLRRDRQYQNIYLKLIFNVLILLFPSTLLCLLNLKIYKAVRRANLNRRHMSTVRKRDSLTATLFVMTFISVLTSLGTMLHIALRRFFGYSKRDVVEVYCLRTFLTVFNSSINFFIYSVMSSKFRRQSRRLWNTDHL